MKYIKEFEKLMSDKKDFPMVGEYILSNDYVGAFKSRTFVNSHIGICIEFNRGDKYPFVVQYENIPEDTEKYFNKGTTTFSRKEILCWSDNIEDLETILQSRKFNI